MYRDILKVVLASVFLVLAACSSTPEADVVKTKIEPAPTTVEQTEVVDEDSDPYGLGYSGSYLRSLGLDRNPLEYDTIYFPYNSSSFGERGKIIIEAHAKHLASTAATSVILEGHADERGTREYNLALGERRGQSVQDKMNSLGTGVSTVKVISYGEERPVVLENSEDAWRANRRVQILY